MPALLLIAAGLASYAGFACLALAMPCHWAAVSGQGTGVAPHRRRLRRVGLSMLGVACALCVWRDGPGFGSLLWLVLIPAAAIAVALTLSWQPRLLLPIRRTSFFIHPPAPAA
jgi:hypothetical protein